MIKFYLHVEVVEHSGLKNPIPCRPQFVKFRSLVSFTKGYYNITSELWQISVNRFEIFDFRFNRINIYLRISEGFRKKGYEVGREYGNVLLGKLLNDVVDEVHHGQTVSTDAMQTSLDQ